MESLLLFFIVAQGTAVYVIYTQEETIKRLKLTIKALKRKIK